MQFNALGICSHCKKKGKRLDRSVLNYHVSDISKIQNADYFLCKSPDCEVVYFSLKNIFTCKELNKEVRFKNYSSPEENLCYCFNHKKKDIDEHTLGDIEEKMKSVGCKCEIRNPQGFCCMSGIKKYFKGKK
jgi:hypothetical protein